MLAEIAVQYAVRCEPAQLAELTSVLAAAGVNLGGVLATTGEAGFCLKFLADQSGAARRKLEEGGYSVSESRVFRLNLEPRSPSLHRLAAQLAERGINIKSCYGQDLEKSVELVLDVDRPDEAAPIVARAR